MKPKEIRQAREKFFGEPSPVGANMGGSSAFWMSEACQQLAELNAQLEKIFEIISEKAVPVKTKTTRPPGPRYRTYYAREYVPSLPVKLDYVSSDKPKEGKWEHEVVATSRQDAETKLINRLTREREAEQEHYARQPEEPLDQAS